MGNRAKKWQIEVIWQNTNENYVYEKLRTYLVRVMSADIHCRKFRLPIFCQKHYD